MMGLGAFADLCYLCISGRVVDMGHFISLCISICAMFMCALVSRRLIRRSASLFVDPPTNRLGRVPAFGRPFRQRVGLSLCACALGGAAFAPRVGDLRPCRLLPACRGDLRAAVTVVRLLPGACFQHRPDLRACV